MTKIFVTIFYVGFLPFASGTFGSLVAVVVGFWIQSFGGFPALLVSIILCFFLGWYFTHQYVLKNAVSHDPKEIVIDEVIGQWTSYLPISFCIWTLGPGAYSTSWHGWIIPFFLFRLFDIWKPWPVSWADNKKSSFGVMLDDLLAGIYAALVIVLFMEVRKIGQF